MNLSLCGRINVAKTFLLGQIAYVGTLIRPPENLLIKAEELIYEFIKKNLPISRVSLTAPSFYGGLGFPELRDFVKSLQVNFLIKSKFKCDKLWSMLLSKDCQISIDTLFELDLNNSVVSSIQINVMEFNDFLQIFDKTNTNWLYINIGTVMRFLKILGPTCIILLTCWIRMALWRPGINRANSRPHRDSYRQS